MDNLLTSSVGKKLVMSLAGLFLVVFLVVHLAINLLLVFSSNDTFNIAAHFMGTNPVIKIMEITLFGGFLLHMVYGAVLSLQNKKARPVGYKKDNHSQTSFFSKYMVHTAFIITIFLVLHLFDFYIKSKFLSDVGEVTIDGKEYHDLANLVIARFQITWVVIVYVVALIGLGFHLHHGFQSAFQSLGINHPVYSRLIKWFGYIYTLVITLGYISIPLIIYFYK